MFPVIWQINSLMPRAMERCRSETDLMHETTTGLWVMKVMMTARNKMIEKPMMLLQSVEQPDLLALPPSTQTQPVKLEPKEEQPAWQGDRYKILSEPQTGSYSKVGH